MKNSAKETFSFSVKVLLRMLLSSVLCLIVYYSMMMIGISLNSFSYVQGYYLYDNVTNELITEHTYSEGEKHISKKDIEENQRLEELRAFYPNRKILLDSVTQILLLILLAIFPYSILWNMGNRDDTNVRYKGKRFTPLRGFWIGSIAMVPYGVLTLLLALTKFGLFPSDYSIVYRLVMTPFFPYINWVTSSGVLENMATWRLLLLLPTLLFVPTVCGIAYRLGHKQYSVEEHLVFSKENKGDSDSE